MRPKASFEWTEPLGETKLGTLTVFVRHWGRRWFAGIRNEWDREQFQFKGWNLREVQTYLRGLGLAGSAQRLGTLARS